MDTLGPALQAAEAGARVSGIAVVRWVGPRKDVRTWTGAVVAKRECEVVDATLRPTTLAVWGVRQGRRARRHDERRRELYWKGVGLARAVTQC